MRDPARIHPIMDFLEETWKANPDWRLTQLLVNTAVIPNFPGHWYYAEDDELLTAIAKLKNGARRRDGGRS